MKYLLIFINILLFAALMHGAFLVFKNSGEEEDPYFFKKDKKTQTKVYVESSVEPVQKVQLTPEEMVQNIVKKNIFDSTRCPNARTFGRNRNASVAMTLVGTFEFGDLKGAIILQKNQNNQQQMPMMGPPGMMGPPPDMMQNGNNNNRSRNNNRGSQVNRFRGPMGMPPGMNQDQNQTNSTENLVYQQYVRVGETLANGYTLVEVSRTSATLKKGSQKLELALQESSANAGASSNNSAKAKNNSRNSNQQQMPGMMGPPGMMGSPGMMGPPGMQGGPMNQNNSNQGSSRSGRSNRSNRSNR